MASRDMASRRDTNDCSDGPCTPLPTPCAYNAASSAVASLNPLPGMVTVDAVAKAALFLVSDDAAFITAVALPIDGGYTAR